MGHRKNRKILVGKVLTGNDNVDDERVHERICHILKWIVSILIYYVVIGFGQFRYDTGILW